MRVIFAEDSPGAFSPKRAASASGKSFVEIPANEERRCSYSSLIFI
jgi:hypothetical protein